MGLIAAGRSDSELGRLVGLEDGPGDWSPKLLTLSREGHSEQAANVFSYKKHLLRAYFVPGTILGTENTAVNKTQKSLASWIFYNHNK